MKILVYLPYKFMRGDSRSTSIRNLVSYLEKENDIYIATPFSEYSESDFQNTIIIHSKINSFIIGNLLLNFFIQKHIKKVDVVIARPDTFLAFFLLTIKNHLLLNIHTVIGEEAKITNLSPFHKLNMILTEYFRVFLLKKVDGVIFNHPNLEKYFKSKFNIENTISIYNGINNRDFYPLDLIKKSKNKIVAIFAGNISVWHGLIEVCDFFERVLERYQIDFTFRIIGSGDRKTIEKIRKYPFVELLGRLPLQIVNEKLNEADFCVVNINDIRVSPGSPIKLFDYIGAKKPILTKKNIVGYADIVEKYRLGIAISFLDSDIEEFIEFIYRENKGDYLNAINEYSWENQSRKWYRFINSTKGIKSGTP